MIDPLFGMLLLWALSRGKAATPGGGSLFPSPRPGKPVDRGGGGASTFPVTPPAPSVPVRSATPTAKWKPYPAPIPTAIVARAQELLRDSSMRVNEERHEPDPAGSGIVRFWKVNQPPGKISVTAWKPTLAQERPAGNPPPMPRPLHSTLSTAPKAALARAKQFPGRIGPKGAGGGPGSWR